MASLKTYKSKRDFARTPEPSGSLAAAEGNRFVVHKHSATADHYDLRLELGGVLKSWAVPKGPSLDPEDKRLAVETEDHPLEYIDFEGVIPKGEYGGGPMIVWDQGVWAPMDDPEQALAAGAFKFRLAGEKLNGGWMLARLKPKQGETKKNWLLFKERDQSADPDIDILAERPESVKSGRRIEELVEEPKTAATPPKAGRLRDAAKAPFPAGWKPQLATATDDPPNGDKWLHEIKFDGYRTLAYLNGGEVKLITRSGLDWTDRYAALAERFRALPCKQAVLDGEVVVPDESGITRFEALQQALSDKASERLVFYAFDLLYLDGYDLRKVPLAKRKDLARQLLEATEPRPGEIQFSDHVEGDGSGFFERVFEMGLEGIVSKRADARYEHGRSKTWLKIKAPQTGDFVVGGYTVSAATGGLAALALGTWDDGTLVYSGKVGTGFDAATLKSLLERLEPLRAGAPPFEGTPKDVLPVRPVLSAHIHYSNRTTDGMLRHAVFKGLREPELTKSSAAQRTRLISDADLASIWVTNPERRVFGKSGPTKLDIAVYYASVGDFMLPHILGRPVSLMRCPTGRPKDCFYQRHAFAGMPSSVATFDMKNTDGESKRYIAVEDAKAYLALAQFGVVEFHAWGSMRKKPEKADRIIFDLDPGEGIAWREVVEAAVHLRGEIEKLGLVPFVKTSGGRGVHLTVPIVPGPTWKQVHQATGKIADKLAATAPELFTTTMGSANRKGRIFIDFHRNARGATAVAPFSLRARTNLPASTPLSWADLESIDAPEDLNYSSLPGLLISSGDPWAEIGEHARKLPGA
ncbi:MAG: DNA ligase D [Rhizobiaceae bacterium]|nr:DNA ligase D [Rhizobiaceae bacterium]